jgi:hypothetical protein
MEEFDLAAAQSAVEQGCLEDWVHQYLNGPGRNVAFSHGLRLEPRRWRGPVEVPLAALRRCCGPEPDMEFREPLTAWNHAVDHFARSSDPVEAFPPLLVRYEQGELLVTDGNHRYAAFQRRGFSTCWIVLWYPNASEFTHHEALGFRVSAA